MQAAATAPTFQPDDGSTPLILRNDTMLGVCTGLGQDFGFVPLMTGATIVLYVLSLLLSRGNMQAFTLSPAGGGSSPARYS